MSYSGRSSSGSSSRGGAAGGRGTSLARLAAETPGGAADDDGGEVTAPVLVVAGDLDVGDRALGLVRRPELEPERPRGDAGEADREAVGARDDRGACDRVAGRGILDRGVRRARGARDDQLEQ